MIGVDWIACLPTTAAGFDMIQNHVDLLSGRVYDAVPTSATVTAADAEEIICDMCLRSGAGFPDALIVDYDPKFITARLSQRHGVVPGVRQGHGLKPHCRLGEEHQRQGGAGERSHKRHTPSLCKWTQGRLGPATYVRRVCDQQRRLDSGE
jgi:hypothetical protein